MPPSCVQESTAAYRKEMDHTGRWLDQGVEPLKGGKVFLKTAYEIYRQWFKDEVGDFGAVSIQKLADRLEQAGYVRGHGHAGATFFEGLSMKVFGDILMTPEQSAEWCANFVAGQRERQRRIDDNR